MSKYIKLEDALKEFRYNTDYYGRLADLPTIEVSEDCISREYMLDKLDEQYRVNRFEEHNDVANIGISQAERIVVDAPSVVPQVPSEDCISREWLLNYTHAEDVGTPDEMWKPASEWVNAIKSAPSVVPSRAEGEWIGTEYDGYADGNPVYYEWICSACKCVVEDEEPTWNFCPNCGARMKEADK